MKKSVKTAALAAALILLFGLAACKKPDYSFYAGDYRLVGVAEGGDLAFAKFSWLELTLFQDGKYNGSYLYQAADGEKSGSFSGGFTISENKIAFTGALSGEGAMQVGYFTVTLALSDSQPSFTFVLS